MRGVVARRRFRRPAPVSVTIEAVLAERGNNGKGPLLKASDLFVKALEAEGVKFVFGIPGEENLDLLNSIRESNIRLVLTRHEQAAGFMAATYGRITGNPGVCLATLGPGATNLVTAAAYAQLGAMPMVMIVSLPTRAISRPVKKLGPNMASTCHWMPSAALS